MYLVRNNVGDIIIEGHRDPRSELRATAYQNVDRSCLNSRFYHESITARIRTQRGSRRKLARGRMRDIKRGAGGGFANRARACTRLHIGVSSPALLMHTQTSPTRVWRASSFLRGCFFIVANRSLPFPPPPVPFSTSVLLLPRSDIFPR